MMHATQMLLLAAVAALLPATINAQLCDTSAECCFVNNILVEQDGNGIVTVEHRHDQGKLLFAFTVFWAYIGFSQYMLIWYARLGGRASMGSRFRYRSMSRLNEAAES